MTYIPPSGGFFLLCHSWQTAASLFIMSKTHYSRTLYIYIKDVIDGVIKVGKTTNPKGRYANSLMWRELSKPDDVICLEVAAKRLLRKYQLSKAAAKEHGTEYGNTELFGCSVDTALEILSPLFTQYAIAH